MKDTENEQNAQATKAYMSRATQTQDEVTRNCLRLAHARGEHPDNNSDLCPDCRHQRNAEQIIDQQ